MDSVAAQKQMPSNPQAGVRCNSSDLTPLRPTVLKVKAKIKFEIKLPPGSGADPGKNHRSSERNGRSNPPPGGGSQDENKKAHQMQLGKSAVANRPSLSTQDDGYLSIREPSDKQSS